MATSTCVKCNNNSFELRETVIRGSNYKHHMVQCSNCGGVVGVLEYFNIGARTETLEKKIDQAVTNSRQISDIQQNVGVINENIRRLFTLIQSQKK